MATIDLGKIKPIWKGTWTGSTAYEKNDMVINGVNSYICTTAHTSHASTFSNDSANWDTMAYGAELPAQSGNAGLVLKTDGSTLSWGQGGGLVKLGSGDLTGSEVTVLDLNYFTTDYTHYIVYLDQLVTTNTGNIVPFIRFNHPTGGERSASQYHWSTSHPMTGSGGASHNAHGGWNDSIIRIHGLNGVSGGSGTTAIGGLNCEIHIYDPMDQNTWTQCTFHSTAMEHNETQQNHHIGGGLYRATEQHHGIRVQYSGDTMCQGHWSVYGVAR